MILDQDQKLKKKTNAQPERYLQIGHSENARLDDGRRPPRYHAPCLAPVSLQSLSLSLFWKTICFLKNVDRWERIDVDISGLQSKSLLISP